MASTYSDLKFELITTGEQSGTWGTTTDTNIGTAIQEAITGSADVAFSSADVTVTLTDTNTAQTARNLRLNLTGTSGGERNLILGSGCQIEKLYLINNGLADAVTVKNTTGTGIAVPAGKSTMVFNTGVNVVDAVTYLSSLASPSATITTLNSSGGALNGSIGGTTPAAGAFTTVSASGTLGVTGYATFGSNGEFNGTGALKLPAGTTAQQPTPIAGMIRYNTTLGQFQGYGVAWGSIGGGGATGGGSDQVFNLNDQTVTADYSIPSSKNATSAGPITINTGVTVTISTGSVWVIV